MFAVCRKLDGVVVQHGILKEKTVCKNSFGVVDKSGFGGVGVMFAEKWIEAVLSVKRLNHCCMQIRFLVGTVIINVISCYAPQAGLSAEEKDEFYEQMINLVYSVPDEEMLLIGGDLNGHVGENTVGFEDVHGGHGYGNQNPDGVRILDFCLAN